MSYSKHNNGVKDEPPMRMRNRHGAVTLACPSKHENAPCRPVYKANKPITTVHVCGVTGDRMSLYNEKANTLEASCLGLRWKKHTCPL